MLIKVLHEAYPCPDAKHTQSAIGYVEKYKRKGGAPKKKALANKAKVGRAAKKFGIKLPSDW